MMMVMMIIIIIIIIITGWNKTHKGKIGRVPKEKAEK